MVTRKAASLLLLIWLCVIGAVQGRTDPLNKGRSLAAADESTSANAADQRDPWLRNQGNGGNGWGAGGGGGWGSLGGSSGPRNDNRGDNGGGLSGFGGGRNDRRNDRTQLAAAPAAAPLQQWFQQPQQPQQQGNPGISGLGGRAQGAQNLWTRGMGGLGGGNSNDNNNDNSDNSGQQQQGGNRGGRNNWLGGRQQQIAPVQTADPTPQPTIVIPDNNRNRNNNNDNVGGLAGRNQGWGNWGQQQGWGNQNGNDRNQEQQGATVTPAVVAPIGRGTGGLTGRPGGSDSWNGGRNRPSLSPLVSGTEQYGRINARPIQVDGEASALAQGLGRRGNARAAATALATAYNSGRGQAAAQAVASAAAGGGDAFAIGEAVAETTYRNPKAAPWLLRQSADVAVNTGNTRGFSRAMSSAFVTARRNRYMPQFTSAVADAIATGGAPTRYAYGQAIATAIADGGDGQAAVAEATATAFCSGGSTASAWAQAYAVALSQNSQGCLVLSQAKALAVAKCGNGVAETFSRAQATSTVLGFCGLFDLGLDAGWSGATTESSATGNGFSDANGWGNTDGGYGGWGKK